VRNGQLRGFSPDEIELLAATVRWHRSGDPRVTDEFPLLDAAAVARVRTLAALLRVADGLDRAREQNVYGLDTMVTPSLVLVRLRRRGDAELEIWGARRKRALFEKVFDRELELSAHPAVD
jgi:exopolyphosphatase/guanosine-5'-triphosphate,3'-diphosphate pyrophosphatase